MEPVRGWSCQQPLLVPFEPVGGERESFGDGDTFCGDDEGVDGSSSRLDEMSWFDVQIETEVGFKCHNRLMTKSGEKWQN